MSPLSTYLNTPSGSLNSTLSEDYSKKLRSSNDSSNSANQAKNLALTKYDNYRLDSA